ncbi:MAG: response regulator transcription factor [Candidatus Pelethousia sp.]|nr:response regulator transcription factor [Candidatus Pelethousia sp.]
MTDELSALVIEDDKYISNFISVSLKKEGYKVMLAESADEGMFLLSSNHPDIVLLDLGLPDRDGLEVIREIRSFSNTPILVVSARGQEKEKIEALDLGADDYISKPFHMGELLARTRVIKRRLGQQLSSSSVSVFECDYLTVDYEKRRVLVDGNEVHLTPMEYKLLLLMIVNKGKVLTHNYIVKEVWGYEETGDTKTIRVFMAKLRRKIEKNVVKPRFILTEIGIGYRFADE